MPKTARFAASISLESRDPILLTEMAFKLASLIEHADHEGELNARVDSLYEYTPVGPDFEPENER